MNIKRRIRYFTGIFVMACAVLFSTAAVAQVAGCPDPLATNYNPLVTVNDGSCTYSVTSRTPVVKVNPLSDTLIETSGLQMAANYLWSFNDGGGSAAIYRIDTISNALLQRVYLQGATNVDWEDIAFDGLNFYVGDFGNNANGARTDLKIYKFPLSAIPDFNVSPVVTITSDKIEVINFTYSNQPQPPVPTTNNNTKFDCEAMIIDGGKIHLFTKNWINLNTTHYEINSLVAGTFIAQPIETLATNYLVTAADKSYGQKIIALLGYQATGFGNHYLTLLTDYTSNTYFSGNKRQINLPNALIMGQAEGICFRNGTYGYISNERVTSFSISQKLFSFYIGDLVSNAAPSYTFTGNGNWDVPANWRNNIAPPASLASGSEIIIDPSAGGICILNIPYTIPTGTRLIINSAKAFIVQASLTIN
ncbi:MAG: hypothetical protein H7211_17010 [Aquabacterium sp.]|nr:hypothetical protein [Ferruginibacter sp.]